MDNQEKQVVLDQDQQVIEMDEMSEQELILALDGGSCSNKEWQE